MTESKDGGSAFPRITYEGNLGHPGMSLRDWFAGQFIAGTALGTKILSAASLADKAYEAADDMLVARNEGESE